MGSHENKGGVVNTLLKSVNGVETAKEAVNQMLLYLLEWDERVGAGSRPASSSPSRLVQMGWTQTLQCLTPARSDPKDHSLRKYHIQ